MPSLATINVTPVKATALQQLDTATLGSAGLEGNRRFYLIDARERLFTGSAHGQLVQVRSEVIGDALRCTFPDGSVAEGPTERTGKALVTDFYGRPVPGHELEGPFGDAFSAYAGTPLRLVRTDRDGDGADILPVTLLSHESVADLGSRGGYEGGLEPARFRMNLELEGSAPFEEDTWDGRQVAVGDAVVRLRGAVPRCVVTTQDPATGIQTWNTLKQIAAFRQLIPDGVPFGMYAEVEVPGRASRSGTPSGPSTSDGRAA